MRVDESLRGFWTCFEELKISSILCLFSKPSTHTSQNFKYRIEVSVATTLPVRLVVACWLVFSVAGGVVACRVGSVPDEELPRASVCRLACEGGDPGGTVGALRQQRRLVRLCWRGSITRCTCNEFIVHRFTTRHKCCYSLNVVFGLSWQNQWQLNSRFTLALSQLSVLQEMGHTKYVYSSFSVLKTYSSTQYLFKVLLWSKTYHLGLWGWSPDKRSWSFLSIHRDTFLRLSSSASLWSRWSLPLFCRPPWRIFLAVSPGISPSLSELVWCCWSRLPCRSRCYSCWSCHLRSSCQSTGWRCLLQHDHLSPGCQRFPSTQLLRETKRLFTMGWIMVKWIEIKC